jgi:phosphoribosylformimino-5-aminoimidazole carboxamide ribotide isomerase
LGAYPQVQSGKGYVFLWQPTTFGVVVYLKVIPVVDVLDGVAVHAVKGKRSEYKPIKSTLTKSTSPLELAKTLHSAGFSEVYIADLDAIIECSTNFGLFSQIVEETGLNLMVDAGITNLDRAQRLLDSGVARLIIGTETLENKKFVAQAIERFGSSRIVASLDLKGNNIIAKEGFDGCRDPLGLLQEFKSTGVSQVIVLDLSRVGSGEGVDVRFLKETLKIGLEVYVGGGVRDIGDLVELNLIGVKGALVATALHTGKISVSELRQQGFI